MVTSCREAVGRHSCIAFHALEDKEDGFIRIIHRNVMPMVVALASLLVAVGVIARRWAMGDPIVFGIVFFRHGHKCGS